MQLPVAVVGSDLESSEICDRLIGWVFCGANEGYKRRALFALAKEVIPGGAKDGLQLVIQLALQPRPVCGIPHAISNDSESLMAPQLQHCILHKHHSLQTCKAACTSP